MKEDFIDTIKSRGYWRINFQPTGKPANLSLKECEELVDKNSVKLRGWYYPFYGHGGADNHGISNYNNYVGGWIDAGEYKEFWRMYRSGQFLHYSAVQEDWLTQETRTTRFNPNEVEPGKYLNFVGSLTMHITEILEFLTRLHRSGLYSDGVSVSISLHNTKGRELTSFEFMRHLSTTKMSNEDTIVFDRTYTPNELTQPARDLAIEPIQRYFELFNFADVSIEQVIKKDQDQLYGFNSNS